MGGAQSYGLLTGEEVVLGVAGRAGGGRERVQDTVYVEQEQGKAGCHCLLIVPWAGRAGKSRRPGCNTSRGSPQGSAGITKPIEL